MGKGQTMGQYAANRAALLTCVSNFAGVGPGHSAVVVDGYVYTFERVVGAWRVSNRSGWVQIRTKNYLDQNRHRPVVVQEFSPGKVRAGAIRAFIAQSDAADDDYLSSGVCSQLAAEAIGAGILGTVDPNGPNIPYTIYRYVKRTGCVAKSYYTFPDEHRYPRIGHRRMTLLAFTPECGKPVASPDILRW
jgi:hypothetical protein